MQPKNKILFMARRFPPSAGGMERYAYELSRSLSKVHKIRMITWGGSNIWLPIVLPCFFLRACWSLLTDKHIKVIHIQDAVQAPMAWLLSRMFRKPYVITVHGLDITYHLNLYQYLVLPFVRRADMLIPNSNATRLEAIKRGVSDKKMRVITLGSHDDYNGKVKSNRPLLEKLIDIRIGDRPVLFTMGRLVRRKGVAWFIENSLPGIIKKHPNVLYIVAGEGQERRAIETAIEKTNVGESVLLLGLVSNEVRSLLYQSSDVFVMPNIKVRGDIEGFGMVAHEAASAELPVVASNLEGIKDAVQQNKNGILLDPKDNRSFTETICRFLDDNKLRNEFGRKARSYTLKEYSWTNIANKYTNVYEEVVKNGKK